MVALPIQAERRPIAPPVLGQFCSVEIQASRQPMVNVLPRCGRVAHRGMRVSNAVLHDEVRSSPGTLGAKRPAVSCGSCGNWTRKTGGRYRDSLAHSRIEARGRDGWPWLLQAPRVLGEEPG